jgi:hypothetical protein
MTASHPLMVLGTLAMAVSCVGCGARCFLGARVEALRSPSRSGGVCGERRSAAQVGAPLQGADPGRSTRQRRHLGGASPSSWTSGACPSVLPARHLGGPRLAPAGAPTCGQRRLLAQLHEQAKGECSQLTSKGAVEQHCTKILLFGRLI